MNHKKVLNIALVFSLIFLLVGIFFVVPEKFGFCQAQDISCIYQISEGIGQPLFLGFSALGLTFLLLRFLPLPVFKAWLYFAGWYVPLAAVWIIITPTQGGHFLAPDKEGLTWLLGGIYLAISLLIIIARGLYLKFSRKAAL